MKKVLLLTPGYNADDIHIDASPVVNYFAREWKNLGYDVRVVHLHTSFPWIMRTVARPFVRTLESKLGVTICTETILEKEYNDKNVPVYRIPMTKFKPHTRFKKSQINNAVKKILNYCKRECFVPDVIISHFVNPCVEIMIELKAKFNVPIVDVLHSNGEEFKQLYGDDWGKYKDSIDIMGYRCNAIRENFENQYGTHKNWFYCYSGIPSEYVTKNNDYRHFQMTNRFIYVGNFRPRKHAESVVEGVAKALPEKNFEIKFIGAGAGDVFIKQSAEKYGLSDSQVRLLGFMGRESVRKHMQDSDVFVLISSNEVFGLVYLEAMSTGCIPIASKREGFDGIIKDGVNGFLCEAGDSDELANIIKRIKSLPIETLQAISDNAMNTARQMTDQAVAKEYIETVFNLIKK